MCYATTANTPQLKRAVANLLIQGMLWLSVLSASLVLAQSQPALINFVDGEGSNNSPPIYASSAQRIVISSALLMHTPPGSELHIQISDTEFVTLQVAAVSVYINGDRMVRAQGSTAGQFYSLALTIGQQTLFGHLSTSEGVFQIYAVGGSAGFEGWLYRPESLGDGSNTLQNDYLIPDYEPSDEVVDQPMPTIRSTLPFKLSESPLSNFSDTANATVTEIATSNFKISHEFSRAAVIVGNAVEAEIIFENISAEWHRDLYVEIFFVLENTRLLFAPEQCREQLSLSAQAVLYCELGDFAPGETKSFIYGVTTSEDSKPLIFSTAIVGNVRLDSFVNVVDDVRTDTDGDGISDFNEALLNTDPQNPDSVNHGNAVIDVMAFYTPGASALFPHGVETRINQLISVANQIYSDSGVGITLRPVYLGEVNYNDVDDMDTALDHLIEKTDPAFAEIDELRVLYGGDLVMLFRPLGEGVTRCGLAPVGGFNTNGDFTAAMEKDFAYSHIAIDCPVDIIVAHELGHNMGLTHSHLEDGGGGTFSFATGHGVESQFVTLMAFPAAFNTERRIALFSNPLLDCFGFACGISSDQEFGADATQSLNLVKYQIANFFPTRVPDLPETAVATISGQQTSARIAIAASSNNGLSFSSAISPNDLVDIVAEIDVDDLHVGLDGTLHILIGLVDQESLYQFNGAGELELWDGTVAGLIALGDSKPLRQREHLTILNGYRFDASLVGLQFVIYVAYRVSTSGEVIHMVDPLVLAVREAVDPSITELPDQD